MVCSSYSIQKLNNKTTSRLLFDIFFVIRAFPLASIVTKVVTSKTRSLRICVQYIANVEKSKTTRHYPMGNGMHEHFNQTLLNMLGTLEYYQKFDWKYYIPPLVNAYNSTHHENNRFSPHYLMFWQC